MAAIAAAAADSALTKLMSRQWPLLSRGGSWVGLSVVPVGSGGNAASAHTRAVTPSQVVCHSVTRFGLDTPGWTELELEAGWLDDECSRLRSVTVS